MKSKKKFYLFFCLAFASIMLFSVSPNIYAATPKLVNTITNAFEQYIPILARDEIIKYKGKDVKLKLVKNPVSFSESIRELLFQKRTKYFLAFHPLSSDCFPSLSHILRPLRAFTR